MNAVFKDHIPEARLETYALGNLSDEECAPLEEHLLVCSICQRRLERTDEYIRLIRTAASSLARAPAGGIRRFVPELLIPATVPRNVLLYTASTLVDIGFTFTSLVALGHLCFNRAWTWTGNGMPRLG